MKKLIVWLISTVALLLLVACGPESTVEPTGIPEDNFTPTPTLTLTLTPTLTPGVSPTTVPFMTATPSPVPTAALQATVAPTAGPTLLPSPTASPSPMPSPTVTPMPSPTSLPTATPTPEPTAAPTPEPTATPTPLPTASPTPSLSPTPTVTPAPTATPTPSPTPTPTVNPEPLVLNGWQKAVSIEGAYNIVFPEMFRDSSLAQTDRELMIAYTCAENEEIKFMIQYVMKKTLMETEEELLQAGGIVTERLPEEQRIAYLLEQNDVLYQGILLEAQYSGELLGNSFGEEEWITGIMNVIVAYPADHSIEYQTEKYRVYVVNNGEEN